MTLTTRAREIYREDGLRTLVSKSFFFLLRGATRGGAAGNPVVKRIGHATSEDLETWHKDPANPVFTPSDPPVWDSHIVEDPTAIVLDGTVHVLYAGTDEDNPKRNYVGHAVSETLQEWERDPQTAVFTPGESGSWDSRTVQNPGVELIDDTFHLVYDGGNEEIGWAGFGHATSEDLKSWDRQRDGPVLRAGPDGTWDSTYVADPCLFYDDGTTHLFYAGFDDDHWQVGHATSTDLSTWEKDPANPIVSYDHRDDWDYTHVGDPTVLRVDDTYHMIHIANTGEEKRLEHAVSEDLSEWESSPEPALTPEPAGTWEDTRITNPTLFEFEGTYHLLYAGVDVIY